MSSLIFITGGTGFIGSHVVDVTLKAGYRVRLSVRKEEQIQPLEALFPHFVDKLEFVVVPDITEAEALKPHLKEVDYVFHLASPMPGRGDDLQKDFLEPAVHGTTAILEAAAASPSIKRVTIMASVLSLMPLGSMQNPNLFVKEDAELDLSIDPNFEYPEGAAGSGAKYHASKILAHKASLDWTKANHPQFSLKTLHPTFVWGKNLMRKPTDKINGTNAFLWLSLNSTTPFIASVAVHVRNVAEAFLKALDLAETSPTEYLLSGPAFGWGDVVRFVKTSYPSLAIKLPEETDLAFKVDVSRADKFLGIEWKSMEEMVGEVIDQELDSGQN